MLEKYIKKAFSEKWAIGQFNFSTLDQLKSIIQASEKMKSPVILGTSQKEAEFFGIEEAAMIVSFYKKRKKVPVFLNLDHGKDFDTIKKAIDSGYDMVHFDGSEAKTEKNIENTIKVLTYARRKKTLVEGEIGRILGKSSYHQGKIKIKKESKISIEDAFLFFEKTKVDLLALAVGNVHGVYSQSPVIDFELLKKVKKKNIPLVFHGGSGVMDKDIKKSIKYGTVKINVNTELRMIWKNSLKKSLKTDKFAPYDLLSNSQKSTVLKVQEKIKLFGSENKA